MNGSDRDESKNRLEREKRREKKDTVQLRSLLVLWYTVFPFVAQSIHSHSSMQSNQTLLFLQKAAHNTRYQINASQADSKHKPLLHQRGSFL